MKELMQYDFGVTDIDVACYVGEGAGALVHPTRKNHGIVLVTSGEKEYIFDDGTRLSATRNRVLYLPEGMSYHVRVVAGGACYAINFKIADPVSFRPFSFETKVHAHLTDCFKTAVRAFESKPFGYRTICKAQLYEILATLKKEYGSKYMTRGMAEVIEPAVSYIHREYTNGNIPVAHLAALCGVSESYFRNIFRSVFGTSPLEYIKELKIARAKELLCSHLYTVSAVAMLSGYHDESYFSREFKKAVGVAPSEYSRKAPNP